MMKYFTPNLIAAANDWIEQTTPELRKAEKRFESAVADYRRELERLKPRVSQAAWDFFRHGNNETGLHDARLLSLKVGDGLNYVPDGVTPFRVNRQRTATIVEFLNYEQSFEYVFDLRRVHRISTDLFVEKESFAKSLGDLYIYELVAINEKLLQLGFLFATGATIGIQFERLVFRRRRIQRQYEPGEMYS
ncbi:MAG TPA: hypothetical protein VNO50_13470 [Pyrinomonadaceae bacterium]|nr:hypothetical protein [Pyrinomonadaceae bacterium]